MKSILARQDVFGWSLTTSVVFHLFVILGISFVMPDPLRVSELAPPLRITLVNSFSRTAPDDAVMLAQSNSAGEDNAATLVLPPSPQRQASRAEMRTAPMHGEDDSPALANSFSEQAQGESNRDELASEINLAWLNSHSNPREKYVSARTREWRHAAYVELWRLAVERVGNLNYPEAARQGNIAGSLVLDVAIRSDGSVHQVRLLRSSGHVLLDDAAIRIVDMAAPFQPFPPQMSAELDILHIVRTWDFGQNQGLTTRSDNWRGITYD